jgi:hypothetical protein
MEKIETHLRQAREEERKVWQKNGNKLVLEFAMVCFFCSIVLIEKKSVEDWRLKGIMMIIQNQENIICKLDYKPVRKFIYIL